MELCRGAEGRGAPATLKAPEQHLRENHTGGDRWRTRDGERDGGGGGWVRQHVKSVFLLHITELLSL